MPMMWHHFQSLRFKLTLLYLFVFGVILAALCFVVLAAWENNVLADLDERLIERADSAADSIGAVAGAGEDDPAAPFPEEMPPGLGSLRLRKSRYFVQIRSSDGTSIVRTPNLGGVRLNMPAELATLRRTKVPVIQTLTGDAVDRLIGPDGEIRYLTRYYEVSGVLPFYLQVGLSMGPFNASKNALRRLFFMIIPVGLLAAGLASWFMARRSLAPIRKIAREAQELTAARLDRRIPEPQGKDEVAEMVVTVNQMLDRLEDAFQAQERFIADAAHELKTPIAIVSGGAQVLSQKPRSGQDYERYLTGLLEEMRRLGQMVDSLLTLARADAGLPLSSSVAVSVNEIVTDVIQRWQPLAAVRSVRLVPVLAMPHGDVPEPQVLGDAELLDSMVGNLVQNGIRYSPKSEAVEVEVRMNARTVTIAVRDRGPGIPDRDLNRVFERFYRVSRTEEANGGTGLGLAIAKGVASLHRGSIFAANRKMGGCEFVVELPLAKGA